MQIANEFKVEFDQLNAQLNKLDMSYRLKIDENLARKEGLKPKLYSLVGTSKGIQLFEADFNPKISQHLHSSSVNNKHDEQSVPQQPPVILQEKYQKAPSLSEAIAKTSDDETIKNIFVDTSTSNCDSGNNSTCSTGMCIFKKSYTWTIKPHDVWFD